jgi:uncharacterized membrane protein
VIAGEAALALCLEWDLAVSSTAFSSILGIHHVLPGHPQQFLFDMLFLAPGVVLAIIGFTMARRPRGLQATTPA